MHWLKGYLGKRSSSVKSLLRNPKFWVILITDAILLFFALYLAYYLRYESLSGASGSFELYCILFPVILIVKLAVYNFFGLYRGMWRYTSTEDLLNIVKASIVSFILILSLLFYINRLEGFSRSVLILDSVFSFLLISAFRLIIRLLKFNRNGRYFLHFYYADKKRKRLLLIGAGDAAEKVLRELKSNPSLPYHPIGMLDDDSNKMGMRIHGVTILGGIDKIEKFKKVTRADEILITIASANRKEMNRIVALCQASRLPYKVVPGLGELIDGKVSIRAIRDISFKDLLGRDEVHLEQDKIGEYITGRTILVTGAGGSIGSELCRQLMRFSPEQIVLMDCSEENLYNIEMELLSSRRLENTISILGRVQDAPLLDYVFRKYEPTVVFHAAAYKHVPLVEENPWQVIHNNIVAAQLLMEAAICYEVDRFVLVSTDKAVRPTNIMGVSKRFTELLLLAYSNGRWDGALSSTWKETCSIEAFLDKDSVKQAEHTTQFMAVRFGNVVGSSGSVIPLFKKQIEAGGPVTVTHPDITRYFMSIEEAAQLIVQAGAMGSGGEIFILKMGDPIKIDRMARDLIKLSGKEPGTEIEIEYTGLRSGEKLFEELITEGEGIIETNHEKIMVLKSESYTSCFELINCIDKLINKAKEYDSIALKIIFRSIIPEYHPNGPQSNVVTN